jgi:hypothetical protein
MTSTHGRWNDHGSRVADWAECLLVVGVHSPNASAIGKAVNQARTRIDMSPSMAYFFGVRFVDMGPRPGPSDEVAAGVARLAIEFTSRPEDVARNFSALIVVDESAKVIERVFREFGTHRFAGLQVRCYGLANKEDRDSTASPPAAPPGVTVDVSPTGSRSIAQVGEDIYRYAEFLIHDFGSAGEQGKSGRSLNEIGFEVVPELRSTIAAAEAEETARKARDAEAARKAEAKQEELKRQAAAEAQRAAEAQSAAVEAQQATEAQCAAVEARRAADQQADQLQRSASEHKADERSVSEGQEQTPDARGEPVSTWTQGRPEAVTKPAPPRLLPSPGDASGCQDTRNTSPFQAIIASASRMLQSARSARKGVEREPHTVEASALKPTDIDELLQDCLLPLRKGDMKEAAARIQILQAYADSEIGVSSRPVFRAVVIADRLLRPGLQVGALALPFYCMVLALAFGRPLDYAGYCGIEDCLASFNEKGRLPRRLPILEAIEIGGTSDFRVLMLTRYHRGSDRLKRWFSSGEVDVRQLITALAGDWRTAAHADIAFEVTRQYLDGLSRDDDRADLVSALRANGYLASVLDQRYPASMAKQATELTALLSATYPQKLDTTAIAEVFAVSKPTPALAKAVLRTLADPASEEQAVRAFARETGYPNASAEQIASLLALVKSA